MGQNRKEVCSQLLSSPPGINESGLAQAARNSSPSRLTERLGGGGCEPASQPSLLKVRDDRRKSPPSQLAVRGVYAYTGGVAPCCGSEPKSQTQLHLEHGLITSGLSDSRQVSLNLLISLGFHVCKMGNNNIYVAKFLFVIKST